jgi:hypothetical protein
MNKFTQTTPQVQPPTQPSYSDRSFLHDTKAGVIVPLWQSMVTGSLVGLLLSIVLSMFDMRIFTMLKWGCIVAIITTTVMWLGLQRRWWNLTKLEYFLGDIDHNGVIGETPPQKITITVNKVKENGHVEVMEHDFPVTDQQIARFFTTVKTSTRLGKGISRREWTPKNVNGFSEKEWSDFYKVLVHQRLVTVRNNECVLTSDGEEIADGWYARSQPDEADATPSPTDEDA